MTLNHQPGTLFEDDLAGEGFSGLHEGLLGEDCIKYNDTYIEYNMSMDVKPDSPYLEKIRKLLADRRGILFASDLAKFSIPRIYLSILEQNKEIERISRGVYKTPSVVEDEMFILQSKYKSCVYSHETALYLHDLTDRSPLRYSLSAPSGYHSEALNRSGHKIFYVHRNLFDLGLVTMQSPHGNAIRVTGLERTICDIARSRNQMDAQFFGEALKRYVGRKEKNIELLFDYARSFRVQKIIRETIEVLL